MTTTAQELGKLLGQRSKEQSQIKENLSPDEFASQLVIFNQVEMVTEVGFTADGQCYDTNSFVIDHPVYGDIDSATLLIDGGYTACPPGDSGDDGRVGIF